MSTATQGNSSFRRMDSSTLSIEDEQVPNTSDTQVSPERVMQGVPDSSDKVQARMCQAPARNTGKIASVMDARRTHQPMNALQKVIQDFLADNPGENYSTIARRGGMSRSTVHSLATVEKRRQTPNPETIKSLARGMNMSEASVRKAAGDAAGYKIDVPFQMDSEEGRLIVAAFADLDDERKRDLARRARFLLAEMRESSSDSES